MSGFVLKTGYDNNYTFLVGPYAMALRKVRELSSAGVMVVDQQYVFLVVG
jgi:hypothetical protein